MYQHTLSLIGTAAMIVMIAITAFTTIITTCSDAQAQSNVTVYGRVGLGIVNYGGYGVGRAAVTQQNNFSSRFGVKGIENLGGGLNAIFTVESGFNADTGAGAIASREASVGLQGGFGKLRLGYMLNALDDLHAISGPGYLTNVVNDGLHGFWANGFSHVYGGTPPTNTATNTATGCSSMIAANKGIANRFAFDNRYGNSIRYDSPSLQGVKFATHLALGQPAGCGAYAWSNKLQYQLNGLQLGLAYNRHHNLRAPGLDDHIILLAGGYNFGTRVYLGAYYQTLQYSNPGLRNLKQEGFGVTARSYAGPATVEAGWYRAGRGRGDQTPVFSGIYVGEDTRADLFILGYRYALSKRTELWSQLAQLRNGRSAQYDLGGSSGGAGSPGLQGRNPRAIAGGIRHDF